MSFIKYFRKPLDEHYISRLRKHPKCKYSKGCTCIRDYLVQYDLMKESGMNLFKKTEE